MTAIDDAVQQLTRHQGLKRVGTPTANQEYVDIEVDVAVELPGRAREARVSATGVRAVETCVLRFNGAWPISAPRVLLRQDFPLDQPHINPHTPGTLVSPCLFDGSLDELLHRFGLDGIVDQLIDWLHRAAGGTLIDAAQGWEPMRRDSCPSTVVFSAERLIAATNPGSIVVIESQYFTTRTLRGIHATLNPALTANPALLFDQENLKGAEDDFAHGSAAAFVARASRVGDKYRPDAVHDYPSLLAFADAFGIDAKALQSAIDDYFRRSILSPRPHQDARAWSHGLYAIVVLLIERPMALIGAAGRTVEVIPYVIRFDIALQTPLVQAASVQPSSHAHALSPELLARTSGLSLDRISIPLTLIGCGSLGSKIAMHLGRAGLGGVTFVDSEMLAPHNIARHALVPRDGRAVGLQYKADLLKDAFKQLSHGNCRSFRSDAVEMLLDPDLFKAIIPKGPSLIVDATASLKVLAASVVPNELDRIPARLLRTSLYGQGRCGVALLESQGRSCRVDDLTAYLFELCRSNPQLLAQMAGDSTELTRVFVGDNCRSLTAKMSDARLSRAATLIALQLERWVTRLPDDAHVGIGVADFDNIGMTWSCHRLGATTVVSVKEEGGWQVRVLKPVVDAIQRDVERWSPKETGGAVIGRTDYTNRTIAIAGLVEAPPDSIREKTRFILGTDGLMQSLRRAHADSLGYLSFIGTWHSHPAGGPHSGIDRRTLAKIAECGDGMPVVSLIWTPKGYACAVDRW